VTPAYPFEGCCEHGPNAHTRDHCMACGCQKPPVQIDTPTPQGEEGRALIDTNVRECSVCWSLVIDESRGAHLDKHEQMLNTLTNLETALRRLTQKEKHND
jgi:hypothetical protein